jgi:hypothetical protein
MFFSDIDTTMFIGLDSKLQLVSMIMLLALQCENDDFIMTEDNQFIFL